MPGNKHYIHDESSVGKSYVRGLTCPIITPEGPNAGWIQEIAQGAAIQDGRLVRVDDPNDNSKDIGIGASLVPFLEHDDTSRLLMGMNIMRQWITPTDPNGTAAEQTMQNFGDHLHDQLVAEGVRPELPLVKTGNEPDRPDVAGGYNLRTAFIMWDGDSFEDALVLSQSAAARMGYPTPLEPGDKLSNRHGTKGVVSRILPDAEMPQLSDGSHVDIIVPPDSIISRMNFGQIREAILGRAAEAEGKPAIVPPFQAPNASELKARLKACGFDEDGMEQLSVGGQPLAHRSTVGVVYWGRLVHLAAEKLRTGESNPGQQFGEQQVALLVEREALSVASEFLGRHDQKCSPFGDMKDLLASRGISTEYDGECVQFGLSPDTSLKLAQPVPHPWIEGGAISEVSGDTEELSSVISANSDPEKLVSSGAPEVLLETAIKGLRSAVQAHFDDSDIANALRFKTRVKRSGRAILVPGANLSVEQVSIPADMAWSLFGDQVAARLGKEELNSRSSAARQALGEILSENWVLIYKSPGHLWSSVTAFRPVVIGEERVVRINPRICSLLDADFDGDQVAVFVPSSPEGQAEAGRLLSVAGHLRYLRRANGQPLKGLIGRHHGMLWGLTELSRSADGKEKIESVLGAGAAERMLGFKGLDLLIEQMFAGAGSTDEELSQLFQILDDLKDLAFEACRNSGVSINPFLGDHLDLPDLPSGEDPDVWGIYRGEVLAAMESARDPFDDNPGTLNVFRNIGARGSDQQFFTYLGGQGPVSDGTRTVFVRHGYRDGLTPDELFACARRSHRQIAAVNQEIEQLKAPYLAPNSRAYGVLARARRTPHPGVVIGRAASRGESDPLTDVEAQLLVGVAG